MNFWDIFRPCFPKKQKGEPSKNKLCFSSYRTGRFFLVFIVLLAASGFHTPVEHVPPGKYKIIQKLTSPPGCNCTVSQGSFTSDLPFFIGTTTANAFYSYGFPLGTSANTGLEMSNTMLIFLYEDSTTGETSLFIIMDQANDGSGGSGAVNFNCLPPTAFMSLADDPGEFTGTSPNITGNFSWSSCCTDGGIIGGIGCGHTFTINPNIVSGIDNFALAHGMPGQAEYIYLPEINCPITINCGGQPCCDEAFEVTSSTTDASCVDVSNGSINLSTVCSNNPVFEWSTGESTEDLTDIPHGNYAVTVTDLNGCSERLTFEIDHGPSPQPEITGPDSFCTGDTDPVTLTVTGSYSSYIWSTGQNSASIDVLAAGEYTVTVTDANGCTGVDMVTITELPVPEPEISGPSDVCPGENITIDAGSGFESYAWSSGQNIQTIDISNPGIYTVTVTNSVGCTASASTTIFALPVPEPDIKAPPGICGDTPVSLDAGPGFNSYEWSTGEDVQEITVLYPGLYYVTVTNQDGCSAYDSVYIDPLPVPEPVIQGLPYLCPGQSTYLDAGSGYVSYTWSNGENGQALEVFNTGILTITVTNAEGCEGITSVEIEEKENILVQVFKTSCNPADTGLFITNHFSQFGCDSMHIEKVSYSESDSVHVFEATCNFLEAGTFTTTSINRYGCDSIHVREVVYFPPDTTALFSGSCTPSETGIFTSRYVNTSGCDSIVVHTISLLPSDSIRISRFSCNPADTGVMVVNYVNRFGCDSIVQVQTYFSGADTTVIHETTCHIGQAGTTQQLFTGSAGCDSLVITIRIWVQADTTRLEKYTCNPGQTGINEVLFTNTKGCDSLVITTTTLLSSDTTRLFSASCDPGQAGEFVSYLTNQSGCDSIVINTVEFSLPDTTLQFFETCNPADTGTIVIRLVNQAGCDSLLIQQTGLLPPSACSLDILVVHDTIGCKENTGQWQLFVENGAGEFTYSWLDQYGNMGSGSFVQSAAPVFISDVPPGIYQITVRNEAGFSGTATVEIVQLQPIQTITSVDRIYNGQAVSCSGAKDGSASVQVRQGGKPDFKHQWSSGDVTPAVDQLGAGIYYVTVSDNYGCEKTDSVIITEPDPLIFRHSIIQPDCHNGEKGAFYFDDEKGGTAPYQFSNDGTVWSDQPSLTDLYPGLLTFWVRDLNGCLADTTILIREYDYPHVIMARDTIIERGDEITIIPIITRPAIGSYTLNWEGENCPGCSQITLTPDITRDVTVVVTDSLGCESRATITVFVKEKKVIYIPNIILAGKNQNAHFTIFGSSHLQTIQNLGVYDRWGNKLFNAFNLTPNDPSVGWDGTFDGTYVQEGVYVFKATLLFSDGRSEIYTGDITVLR